VRSAAFAAIESPSANGLLAIPKAGICARPWKLAIQRLADATLGRTTHAAIGAV